MSIDVHQAVGQFVSRFGKEPAIIARAPGRVNVIGEHTDYNHGFVLPMAIEQETLLLANPRADQVFHAYAGNFDREVQTDLTQRARNAEEPWIDYIVGVADELAKLGKPLHGADVLILGDVPIGAGLSSSASLEMAALVLFEKLGGFHIEGPAGPQLGQRVENQFLGLNSGIMDQFIVRMGRKNHVLFLDCRSHAYELVPAALPNAAFVIADTAVSRGLTGSKYNERVAECREAVAAMVKRLGHTGTHLRDFTLEDLEASRSEMADVIYRRARHIITENARTQQACDALRAGDAAALGTLMNASDASLRDDYEVTCPELDAMAAVAQSIEGCYGSRMTGAGFGGCTVSLVAKGRIATFTEQLLAGYHAHTGLNGRAFVSTPADGAGLLALA